MSRKQSSGLVKPEQLASMKAPSLLRAMGTDKRRLEISGTSSASQYAKRLCCVASEPGPHQVPAWKVIGACWEIEGWRSLLQACREQLTPPSPETLHRRAITSIANAVVGLCREDGIVWVCCVYLMLHGKRAQEAKCVLINTGEPSARLLEMMNAALEAVSEQLGRAPTAAKSKIAKLFQEKSSLDIRKDMTAIFALPYNKKEWTTLCQSLLAQSEDAPRTQREVLEEAAWYHADDALARALQLSSPLLDFVAGSTPIDQSIRSSIGELLQAVKTAASRREMHLVGKVGDYVPADPNAHHLDNLFGPENVTIRRPAISKGSDGQIKIVRKAEVA